MARVVVAEKDDAIRTRICTRLFRDGHEVVECNVRQVGDLLQSAPDAVLLGRTAGDDAAIRLLIAIRTIDPGIPIIAIAGSSEEAFAVLRVGVSSVAKQPLHVEELSLLVGRAVSAASPIRRSSTRATMAREPESVLVGDTPSMRSIKDSIRRLAGSPRSAVLVRGEGGSGKDTVAHVIHRTTSDQSPFVYVSPSALSERALEVELLGVESSDELPQGQVGLLERADRGTLYIDEIADTPLALQATLIRFLRDGAFRRLGGTSERFSELRVIAASSRDLQAAVREGTLRSELFQRLSAATIEVPPLRERPSDLPLLTRHLLEAISRRISRPMPNVPDSTMKVLSEYQWPGNVRELANVLERAALLGEAGEIEEKHLGLRSSRTSEISYRLPSQGIDFAELERDVIVQALQHTRGNQSKAAALLGMTRDQIRYRLAKFGLTSRGEAAESAEARAG